METIVKKMYTVEKYSDLSKEDQDIINELYYDNKLTELQSQIWLQLTWNDEKLLPKPNFTEEEKAYRRGYRQGFCAARNRETLEFSHVRQWSYSTDLTAPPGSGLEGQVLRGLTIEDKKLIEESLS